MPTGPKGQKRKVDVIGNAVLIARIATREVLAQRSFGTDFYGAGVTPRDGL
jgi:hypothetical protein